MRVPGIDIDEERTVREEGDREPVLEVEPSRLRASPHASAREDFPSDPERLEGGDLLGRGGEPGEGGVVEDVVEGEKAPHNEFVGR